MPQTLGLTACDTDIERLPSPMLDRHGVAARIEEVGVVPTLRGASAEAAHFVAEALCGSGIPILEIAATTPGAAEVISDLTRGAPDTIVGAGSVSNTIAARRCLEAGAKFLTTVALIPEVVELAAKQGVAVISGAFSPTEIVAARDAGSDFVRVFPCDAGGGARYIRSLKLALPDVPFIASGGITQQNAFEVVAAGATALGLGSDLIPADAVRRRERGRIQELARRFLGYVDNGRIEAAGRRQTMELK